jgi:acyl carrier protein
MYSTIQREVREFVIQNFLFGQNGHLADEPSFLKSGIIDSTGVLELVAFLEAKYAISVKDDELVPANLDSVDCVTRFIERKLTAGEQRIAG